MARRPLHDTLEEARIPDPDGVIKKWRSVRKDNVLAAARTVGELGDLMRSIRAREAVAPAPHTPAASESDLSQIRNLLADSESRISSGMGRVKLWIDEIRDESERTAARLSDRLGEVDGRVKDVVGALESRTKLVNYWFASAIGVGVAAIVFSVVLLVLYSKNLI